MKRSKRKRMAAIERTRAAMAIGLALALALSACSGRSGGSEDNAGVSEKEVRIGASVSFSGPASAWATLTHTEEATFAFANASGGVTMADGKKRQVRFIPYDDGFEPARALDNTRKLIDSDKVLAVAGSVGSANVQAVLGEIDRQKTPLTFYAGSAQLAGDPGKSPWSVGILPSYALEGAIYAQHILATDPHAKVAALVEDAANGHDFVRNFAKVLGDHGITVTQSLYDPTAPSVETNISKLASTQPDVLYLAATTKFAAQAIKKVAELGWNPTIYLSSPSNSVKSVLEPAGLANAKGIYSTAWLKDPSDPQWANDPDVMRYKDVISKFGKGALDPADQLNHVGFTIAELTLKALSTAEPTRTGYMESVRKLAGVHTGLMLPGIEFDLSDGSGYGIKSMQLIKFDGARWKTDGKLISGDPSGGQ